MKFKQITMRKIGATMVALGLAGGALIMSGGVASATQVQACSPSQVNATWDGAGGFTYSLKNSADVRSCTAVVSSYKVPETWNGSGFNQTALPQTEFDGKSVVVTHEQQSATVALPPCGPTQADLYAGPRQSSITTLAGSNGFIAGGLRGHGTTCAPPVKKVFGKVTFQEGTNSCTDGAVLPTFTVVDRKHVNYSETVGTHTSDFGVTVTVTATADEGYTLKGKHKWTHTFKTKPDTGECDTLVTPVAPSVTQSVCKGDTATKPVVTPIPTVGVVYTASSDSYDITATPAPGYYFPGHVESIVFKVDIKIPVCQVTHVTPHKPVRPSTPTNELAFTGSQAESLAALAGLFMLGGIAVLFLSRKPKTATV